MAAGQRNKHKTGRAGKNRRTGRIIGAVGALSLGICGTVPAGNADPLANISRNTYGMPGLIDMPTAEVRPDGEFAIPFTWIDGNTQRNNLTFQISPRITVAFRYSRVPDLLRKNGTPTALYDRSFDVHWAFLDEGKYLPSMAIGLRDFIGTGVYSGEYVVATKSVTPKLRATAGIGWGRLGSFGSHSGWGTRPSYDYSSNGGNLNDNAWFKGDWAPFFGLSYQLNDKWTLKAEYSSDDYVKERQLADFDRRTPFNFAANYHANDYLDLQMFYLYGEKVGFQFSLNIDPKKPTFPSGTEAAPLPVKPRPSPSADPEGWSGAWVSDPTAQPAIQQSLAAALGKEGIILEGMSLTKTTANLRVRNTIYRAEPEAVGRAARIATRALPSSVDTIVITPVSQGMALSSLTFRRSDLEQMADTNSYDMLERVKITDAKPDPKAMPTLTAYPRFLWGLSPYTAVSLFDPNEPFKMDVGAELSARYEAAPGLVLSGSLRQKVAGNIGNNPEHLTTNTPHVRSDSAFYSSHGDLTINSLQAAWYAKPGDNIYSRVTVGLLERMYGGVSGEVLWKPVDSRLALGLETDWVKQRAYDQRFDFLDYSTVTGFASAYYDFGKGYMGELDVGRYLARDWGATFTFNRTFENGWKVGAFATLTDMSSTDFGEGSFDKGIMISIPITWATGKPTLSSINATIRPLLRDGGAMVNVDGRLYDTVNTAHTGELYDGWGRFWR